MSLDGVSTCIPFYNIDVPCNLAWLSLVLFPHVCLWIYGKIKFKISQTQPVNSVDQCRRSFTQCHKQIENNSIPPIVDQMAFWLLFCQFHLGILYNWLYVSVCFTSDRLPVHFRFHGILKSNFDRLIRPTFVAVWQSIYFSHHIFWMTMLVSCTVIGKMMPKTEKVKSS